MIRLSKNESSHEATWPDTDALDEIIVYFSKKYDYDKFKAKVLPRAYVDIFEAVYNRYHAAMLKGVYRTMDYSEVIGKVSAPKYLNEFATFCEPRIKEDIDRIYGFFGSKSCYELKRNKSESCLELIDFWVCDKIVTNESPKVTNYIYSRYSRDGKIRKAVDAEEIYRLHYDPEIT